MAYTPTTVPVSAEHLAEFLREELGRIANATYAAERIQLPTLSVAPSRPREGDIVLADGTNWNPGSGAGFYGYRGGAYVFLG